MRKARGIKRAVRAKTDKEFKDEIYRLVGDEYTFKGTYKNNKTYMKVIHNKCGHEYRIRPVSFTSTGSRCPNCNPNRKKTTEEARKEIYDLVGDEYTLKGEYINSDTKIDLIHNECGYEYSVRLRYFTKLGRRCHKCSGTYSHINGKTTEEYKKEVYREVGDEYVVLGEYTNNHTKINLYHTVCEKEYWVTPNDFVSKGRRCGNCTPRQLKTLEEFKEEVYSLEGEEYMVTGEYINNRTNIEFRHEECGEYFEIRPCNFLSGGRCTVCRESKGERAVKDYLDKNNIQYEQEKSYKDLVYERPLRFDFYLPEYNLLIEYDGEQHFRHVEYFGTYDNFIKLQERDELKNEYCLMNDIPLFRIPYTKLSDIDNVLEETLKSIQRKNGKLTGIRMLT